MDVLLKHVFPYAMNRTGRVLLVCRAVYNRARTSKEFWEPFLKTIIPPKIKDYYIMWPSHMCDVLSVVRSKFYRGCEQLLNIDRHVEQYVRSDDCASVAITYWLSKRIIEKRIGFDFREYIYLSTKTTVLCTLGRMMITSPTISLEITYDVENNVVLWHSPYNGDTFTKVRFHPFEGKVLLRGRNAVFMLSFISPLPTPGNNPA